MEGGERWTEEQMWVMVFASRLLALEEVGHVGVLLFFVSRTIWEGAHYSLTYRRPAEETKEKQG